MGYKFGTEKVERNSLYFALLNPIVLEYLVAADSF